MALTFNGTSSKLVGANIVTGYPVSMFCWIRPASLTASQMVMGAGDNAGATEIAMFASGDLAGDPVRAFERSTAGTSSTASSTVGMQLSTWQPALVIFRSSTSRSVYFADGAEVKNTDPRTASFASFDRFVIGCRPISDTLWASMDIAHAAVWSYALENDDWLNLKNGAVPSSVQPQALTDYWSLDTQAATQTGSKGTVLTASNTAQASTSPTMGQTALIADSLPLRDGGGWCWFSDPRAVYRNGATYVGWVAPNGSIGITKFDHATKRRDYYTLAPNFEIDDHDNPTIYFRPDGRLIVFWSMHNDVTGIRYRISTNAEDITAWGAEQLIATPDSDVSYNNPRYLSGNSRLYQHFRARSVTTYRPQWMTHSDDNGATWAAPYKIFQQADHRPYVKSITNGVDRIDFYMSQGNPGENLLVTNVYHCMAKLSAGVLKFYKSDGVTELTLPINIDATLDKVYDSTASGVSGWEWDACYDSSGYPRILFERSISATDGRYNFVRWNGTAWTSYVEICTAGARISSDASSEYFGGMCFAKDDPNRVIVSREAAGIANLEEWVSANEGVTWTKVRDITTDVTAGIKNARPVVPNGATAVKLLWWRGTYVSYTSFDTDIQFEMVASGQTISPTKGAMGASGKTPTIEQSITVVSATGHGTATGYAPAVSQSLAVAPTVAHIATTGYTPTVDQSVTVAPNAGRAAATGYPPVVSQDASISVFPATGHAAATGVQPTIEQPIAVSPTVGHAMLTGSQPIVVHGIQIAPQSGRVSTSGYVATIEQTQAVSPGAGAARIAGKVPTITQQEAPAVLLAARTSIRNIQTATRPRNRY